MDEPLRWSIGDVTVTAVTEMDLLEKCDFMFPAATVAELQQIEWLRPNYIDDEGALRLRIQAFIVETPTHSIIVDTCVGNDKNRPGAPHVHMLTSDFDSRLARAGADPNGIDIVLCTHLHVDHVGWNTRLEDGRWVPTFPNARYLVARTEFEHWSAADNEFDQAVFGDSVQPIAEAGLLDLVDCDHQICDEIRLIPTPGHTPGHVSVLISSKGEEAIISGDIAHHPAQLARTEWSCFIDVDQEAARTTREKLLRDLAGSDILYIGTHFMAPTAGRIVADGAGYKFV